jgi:molybdopterin synthase catalytic subunit
MPDAAIVGPLPDPVHNPWIDAQVCAGPLHYEELPWPQSCGAEAVFIGRSRAERHTEHGELLSLDYEGYPQMMEPLLHRLALRAARDHRLLAVRARHALGPIPLGAASVLIQCAAGHRAEAFTGCRWLIDEIKRSLPVWKRERWASGWTRVEGITPQPMSD